MEQFWQKLTSFAFHRSGENTILYKIEESHPLNAAGLSEKTIDYIFTPGRDGSRPSTHTPDH